MGTESFLGVKADTSGDEVRIELLDALEIILTKGTDRIIVEVKRLLFPMRFDNPTLPLFIGDIEDVTAHLINQTV